jgi:hypothetical protein
VIKRELVIQRVHDVLKTIAPGVTYPIPGGHAPITTDLKKRVYSKLRAQGKLNGSEKPLLEFQTSPRDADKIEALDDNVSKRTLTVHTWVYVSTGDAGTSHNDMARAQLNAVQHDVSIAMKALPYWTGPQPNQSDSLRMNLGPVIVQQTAEWTEPAEDIPWGASVGDFSITYYFDERFP